MDKSFWTMGSRRCLIGSLWLRLTISDYNNQLITFSKLPFPMAETGY